MTASLQHLKSGDTLGLSTVNKIIDGAKKALNSQKRGHPGGLSSFDVSNTVIRSLVTSETLLPRYAVVGIDTAMFDPNENKASFWKEPSVRVSQPNADTQNFAILQQPAMPGQVVPACVSGVSIVELFVQSPNHQYAVPNAGYTMTTADSGGAKILWRQEKPGDDGKIWGLVLFPVSAAPSAIVGDSCRIVVPVSNGFTNRPIIATASTDTTQGWNCVRSGLGKLQSARTGAPLMVYTVLDDAVVPKLDGNGNPIFYKSLSLQTNAEDFPVYDTNGMPQFNEISDYGIWNGVAGLYGFLRSIGNEPAIVGIKYDYSNYVEFSVNVDANESGQSQTVWGRAYMAVSTPDNLNNGIPVLKFYLRNNVTGSFTFIDEMELPTKAFRQQYVYSDKTSCSGSTALGDACGTTTNNLRVGLIDSPTMSSSYIADGSINQTQFFTQSCSDRNFWNSVNPKVAAVCEIGPGPRDSLYCEDYIENTYVCYSRNSNQYQCGCGSGCIDIPTNGQGLDCGGMTICSGASYAGGKACIAPRSTSWVHCEQNKRVVTINRDGTVDIDSNGGHPSVPVNPYPSWVCDAQNTRTGPTETVCDIIRHQLMNRRGLDCFAGRTTPCTVPSIRCGRYATSTTGFSGIVSLNYDGNVIWSPGVTGASISTISCCNAPESNTTTQGLDSGMFRLTRTNNSEVREAWAIFDAIIAEQTYNNTTHRSVSRRLRL